MILEFTSTETLGAQLRRWRKAQGWTIKEAAMRIGIGFSFLSDLEVGRTHPSFDTLQKLANAYNRPIVIEIKPLQRPNSQ